MKSIFQSALTQGDRTVSRNSTMRFSIRWLFVMVAVCALIAWRLATSIEQKQYEDHVRRASHIAKVVLAADHFRLNEQKSFVQYGQITGAMQSQVDAFRLKQQPEYLLPSKQFKNGDPVDSYEADLLAELAVEKPGTDVYVRHGDGDTVTYYKVIRSETSCFVCHEHRHTHAGQLLAVMKISVVASPP